MPDVFKILKDLELKAVGLDPATNAVQEGYFVSFRSVGLPIHQDDFDSPWSPLGSNLSKDIPVPPPADPSTAPATGSATVDDDRKFAANIGASMQRYLNTFLLTDSQLTMSGDYSVMPGAAHVSDAWYALITGANGIPPQSELSGDLKASYDAAKAMLMDGDGNATPHYQSYLDYSDKYDDARRAWQRAYSDAFTDPMKLQNWPNEGRLYHEAVDKALDRWQSLGFKSEIDTAIDFLASRGEDPAIALIARAKKRYLNSLNEFQGIGQIPYTVMLPNSWADRNNDDGWTTYGSTDWHTESHYQSSSTSYGGGGGFNVGFWRASAHLNQEESRKAMQMAASNLDVSFKYCVVDIKRPWLDSTLLSLKNWFLVGNYKKGCISDGTMGQQRSRPDPTFFPSVVTSLVLVKDLKITWDECSREWDHAESETRAGGSVGWGPFAVCGHYEHREETRNFEANRSGETIEVPGIQLLGYVSMINPLSPHIDSAAYMQQIKPAPVTPPENNVAPADAPVA